MSKITSVDFLNKRVIGEIPINDNSDINDNINTKNEPLKCGESECKTEAPDNKKILDLQIIRNFPQDYFSFKNCMDFDEDLYTDEDFDLSYSHNKYGKYYLTKGIETDKDGQLVLGGITYPTEFSTREEFIEIQEKSKYISTCLKDASSLGYILNASDVIILIYCMLTPVLGLVMNKTNHNIETLYGMVGAQTQILHMAGLIPTDPQKEKNPEKDDGNGKE